MQSHQEIEAYTAQKQAPKLGGRKDVRRGKNDRYCDHCKVKGHQTDQCFKLYGYPEWYKEKHGSKMKIAAHIDTQATPLDHPVCSPEESPVNTALIPCRTRAQIRAPMREERGRGKKVIVLLLKKKKQKTYICITYVGKEKEKEREKEKYKRK